MKAGESMGAAIMGTVLVAISSSGPFALAGSPQQMADADDAVIVAFEKFLRFAREGRFPRLDDRYDLWQILLMVTDQVAVDQRRKLMAAKRGGVVTRSLASLRGESHESGSQWQPVSMDPSPEFAAATAEQCRRLLGLLNDNDLQRIALAKVHGLTNEEIARQEELSLRGIERKLSIIRKIWSRELDA